MNVPPSPAPQALSAPPAPMPKPLATVKPAPKSPGYQQAESEFSRLTAPPPTDPALLHTKANTGAPGVQQVHNKFGRVLGTIADAIGTGLFPGIAMAVPGTTAHHMLLTNQAGHALGTQQKDWEAENKGNLEAAQATEAGSLPAYHQSQEEVKRLQEEEAARKNQATEEINRARYEGQNQARQTASEAMLHRTGYRTNDQGEVEPIPREEMSEQERSSFDLKSAQTELAHATAELRLAQATQDPQKQDLAKQRLDIANRRLGLSQATYNARYLGTDQGGAPLPGAMLTEDNRSVGSTNAANVRPTGTERGRADLATSAKEQLSDMRSIVQKHPEFFGPGAGRATAFQKWIGSQDPEAQRYLTARSVLADHATGVFGARSEGAIAAQRIASGDLKDNPAAVLSALGQMEKAITTIQSKGVVRTAGSAAGGQSVGGGEITKEQYDALPIGATYTKGGHQFVKK
jgi:hypothetical protein